MKGNRMFKHATFAPNITKPDDQTNDQTNDQVSTLAVLADIERCGPSYYDNTMTISGRDHAKSVTSSDEEDAVLRRLGAALIMRWNTLPAKLQKELFDDAGDMGELLDTSALRGQIARFLHVHKNDQQRRWQR
jgi:hypothetical protein